MTYDLIVLGGGPAGYRAAERAADAGMTVALIEERSLGGVCLNEGCIPTKTLLYSAKLHDGVKNGARYGVTAESLTLDHATVLRRKNKVVKLLVAGVKAQMKARQIEVITGCGIILGKGDEGFDIQVGEQKLTGKRLLIATGSQAAVPPIPGLKEGLVEGFVVTNREILDMTQVPERLVVIGGGVIGLEMASYFCSAGSEVTVIEMLDHIAGETDQDVVNVLKTDMEKRGIHFVLTAKVTQLDKGLVHYEKDGEACVVACDKVLLSIGRRAATNDMGLETLGVALEKGYIVTNETLQTNVPGVYAAGDVNGKSMLAHTAYREAEVAVNHMAGREDSMRYDAIPAVIYTNPEIAGIGETEASALAKNLACRVVRLPMQYSGRYQAENEQGRGIMKLIVDVKTERVLGGHFVCNHASEFIVTLSAFMAMGAILSQIEKVVFPHPTVGEVIRDAVFQAEEGQASE